MKYKRVGLLELLVGKGQGGLWWRFSDNTTGFLYVRVVIRKENRRPAEIQQACLRLPGRRELEYGIDRGEFHVTYLHSTTRTHLGTDNPEQIAAKVIGILNAALDEIDEA